MNIKEPVIKTIIKYSNHPSIIAINERRSNSKFSFSFIEKNDSLKETKNLQISKVTQDSDIPTKLIKNNFELIYLLILFYYSIAQSTFPSLLKRSNITPVHKKDSKTSKEHYRSISILSNFSKMYERFMFKQTNNQNKFSIRLMGRNLIRSSPSINFKTSFIQHLFM